MEMDIQFKRLEMLFFALVMLSSFGQSLRFSYAPPESPDKDCILLDIDFNMTLTAFNQGKEIASNFKNSADNLNITLIGSCGSMLMLEFQDGMMWSFSFRQNQELVYLRRLVQFEPNKIFDNVADTAVHTFVNNNVTTLGKSTTSYVCVSPILNTYHPAHSEDSNYTFAFTVLVANVQVQAFNVNNNTFSHPVKCYDDQKTTTALPTTVTTVPTTATTVPTIATTVPTTATTVPTTVTTVPTIATTVPTTVTPGPHINVYTVKGNNVTCIVLEAIISVTINYKANTTKGLETKTVDVYLPKNTHARGNCSLTALSQVLVLTFFSSWSLQVIFIRDEKYRLAFDSFPHEAYRVSNMTLTYTIDQRFPNAVEPKGTVKTAVTTAANPDFPSVAANTGYYKCNSKLMLTIEDDVHVWTQDLEFKAFSEDHSTNFTGQADQCNADNISKLKLLPIILGSCLGGVALVAVLIIVLVVRRKRRAGYLNLDVQKELKL